MLGLDCPFDSKPCNDAQQKLKDNWIAKVFPRSLSVTWINMDTYCKHDVLNQMWNAGNAPCKFLARTLTHPIVQEDIEFVFKIVGSDLNRLQGKRVLITGGTGGSSAYGSWKRTWLNKNCNQPCKVYVPTRNPEAFARKAPPSGSKFRNCLVARKIIADFEYPDDECNFIIHAAAGEPRALIHDYLGAAETIVRNAPRIRTGHTKILKVFLFVSSGAVYGVQPPDLEKRIPEDYLGAPDITNIRSAYGEAKRYLKCFGLYIIKKHDLPYPYKLPIYFRWFLPRPKCRICNNSFMRDGLQGGPLRIKATEQRFDHIATQQI